MASRCVAIPSRFLRVVVPFVPSCLRGYVFVVCLSRLSLRGHGVARFPIAHSAAVVRMKIWPSEIAGELSV